MYQRGGEQLPPPANESGTDAPPPPAVVPPTESRPADVEAPAPALAAAAAPAPVADAVAALVPASSAGLKPWSRGTWLTGLLAAVMAMAGGTFCLMAQFWLPESMAVDASSLTDSIAAPWGYTIIAAAIPLVVAGLALVAGMLFTASRHHPGRENLLRKSTAVLGLLVLAGGFLAAVSPLIVADQVAGQIANFQRGFYSVSLAGLAVSASAPLLFLGLVSLAVLLVVRPLHVQENHDDAGRGKASAAMAFLLSALVIGAGAVALFAPRLFPSAMAPIAVRMGDTPFYQTPWPQLLLEQAPNILLAGLLMLMWGVLIVLSGRTTAVKATLN